MISSERNEASIRRMLMVIVIFAIAASTILAGSWVGFIDSDDLEYYSAGRDMSESFWEAPVGLGGSRLSVTVPIALSLRYLGDRELSLILPTTIYSLATALVSLIALMRYVPASVALISTLLFDLVGAAHMCWRIERDYQDLKQDLGLGHYEGRGWRGFHHYATLSIAAYGFLMAQRLKAGSDAGGKKNFVQRQMPAVPHDYIPRSSPARAASRGKLDHNAALPAGSLPRNRAGALSALQLSKSASTFVTQ